MNDIHAILEITVLDEDKNKVYEFLGKVEIPIINVFFFFQLSVSEQLIYLFFSFFQRSKTERNVFTLSKTESCHEMREVPSNSK